MLGQGPGPGSGSTPGRRAPGEVPERRRAEVEVAEAVEGQRLRPQPEPKT